MTASRNGPEVCDDGNNTTETSCPYGTASCTRCDASCATSLNLTGAVCGDGITNGDEVCDDGNTNTRAGVPLRQADCTRCDATCETQLILTGPVCGDGVRNGPEVCDDGNVEACGTCSATCNKVQLAKASGSILIFSFSNLRDGDSFQLNDGTNFALTFELDRDGSSTGIRVDISSAFTRADVAVAIAAAINAETDSLRITALAQSDVVQLTNDLNGSRGNQPISSRTSRTGNNTPIYTTGMLGGAGVDCPESTECGRTEDCELGLVCRPDNTCGQPPPPPPADGGVPEPDGGTEPGDGGTGPSDAGVQPWWLRAR